MKKLHVIAVCAYMLFGHISALFAQESTLTSGGDISGSGGSVSYAVGQLFYNTSESSNYSIAEGVLQPYEIYIVTSYSIPKLSNLECKVFPNPASDYLTLDFDKSEITDLGLFNYLLYDSNGKLLTNKNGLEESNQIELSTYKQGIYFLSVTYSNQNLKLFKIVKN